MGGKNKDRDRAKRRQRDSMKAAARTKPYRKPNASVPSTGLPLIGPETFSQDDFIFWLAHGVNYLLSDHEQGLWQPVFEEIYQGKLLQPQDMATGLMTRYSGMKEWPLEAKSALGWVVASRSLVYIYYRESLRRMGSAYPDVDDHQAMIRLPAHPVVWGVFHHLKEKLLHKKGR